MIYILHIDPPLAHARHYVGWTKDADVTRRVNEHLKQTGSKLIAAALAAGRKITLAGTIEGDRALERQLKNRGSAASYCPLCRAGRNTRMAEQARARRARRRDCTPSQEGSGCGPLVSHVGTRMAQARR